MLVVATIQMGLKMGVFYHDWFDMFTNYSEHKGGFVIIRKRHGRWEFYDEKGNLENIEDLQRREKVILKENRKVI